MNYFRLLLFVFSILFVQKGTAQNTITIGECYQLARANYPLAKQRGLIEKSREYSLSNAAKGRYPQAAIYGQATYQSAVTQLPIAVPGIDVPTLDKDQYKIYGELSLNLYDGGLINEKKDGIRAESQTQQQQLSVQLYELKKRVNQLYFGVLLIEAQLRQNQVYQNDIQIGMDNIQAAIENGTALKSEGERLKAQLLKAQQKAIALRAARRAYSEMLELFIEKPIDEETRFIEPKPIMTTAEIARPKLAFFNSKMRQIEQQNEQLTAKNLPKLDIFFQGGYGRPALNMLNNDFEAYYRTGIRLKIPLSGFYTLKKERALLEVKKSTVNQQKKTFLLNTNMKIKELRSEIAKYQKLLVTDDRIISLRESVKETLAAQLKYGVVGTNDYLREANAENRARQNKNLHKMQLLLAQYKLQWAKGQLKE